MTIRYDCEGNLATDSGCAAAGVDHPKKAQVLTAENQDAMSVTVPASTSNVHEYDFTTEDGSPDSADWPNGTYGFRIRVNTLQISGYYLKMWRISTGCTEQDQIGGDSSEQTSTGNFTFEVTEDPASGLAADRFQGQVWLNNTETMSKNFSCDPFFNAASEMYIEGPWVAATGRRRAVAIG